ncbi:NAD(+) synthase [Mycoplasmopsis agalactiae]|nr:NAD(+) synthase [Mycoplasmopsis agalactiae]MCE6090560.1 NAD(+) synthase [Mycoplasmopsis agalactiae]
MNKRIGLRVDNSFNSPFDNEKVKIYTEYLVSWIKRRVKRAKAKGCVVGISGGIDSALVASLCAKAFPNNTLGLVMPIDSMNHDLEDISKLERAINLKFKTVLLDKSFVEVKKSLNNEVDNLLSISNIKPRLRMIALYAYAQQNNYLVMGTDNQDEYFIGYFTKHGDGGVDLLPISKLLKSEVRMMAKYLNVPESIINKKPSAGLWEGQSDEDELGFTYHELDSYLLDDKVDIRLNSVAKIERMHKYSMHKRNKAGMPLSIDEVLKRKRKE